MELADCLGYLLEGTRKKARTHIDLGCLDPSVGKVNSSVVPGGLDETILLPYLEVLSNDRLVLRSMLRIKG